VRVALNEHQVGLRTENGTLVEVLAPATRRLYWKGLLDVQIEIVDIAASAEVPAAVVARLVQTQLRQRAVQGLASPAGSRNACTIAPRWRREREDGHGRYHH
jgi:hypothetical protein